MKDFEFKFETPQISDNFFWYLSFEIRFTDKIFLAKIVS
jgi:hypothetical protein